MFFLGHNVLKLILGYKKNSLEIETLLGHKMLFSGHEILFSGNKTF